MLTCSIERNQNAFVLRANDQILPPYAYMTYQPSQGRYADFRAAGVRFCSVAVYAGDRGINPSSAIRPFRPGFMTAPGEYDFRWVDEDFRRATCGARPGEAFLLPRLMLEMPTWWEEAHPEALCRDASGASAHCSFSSPAWLQAATEAMERFEAWLEASGWNEYVVGWHIAAGSTEEYIRPVLHPLHFMDYSAPTRQAFIAWLARKYGDVAALNRAWGGQWQDFAQIAVPRPAARAYAWRGGLRDPIAERDVVDFYAFYSEELALFVRQLCEAGKRITGGHKLMGAFYGNVSLLNPEQGHNSLRLLLESEAVDFFASPFCYPENRAGHVDWPFQATLESAHLHGKPWFVEADVRTFLSRPIRQAMPYANPEVNSAYDAPVWHGPNTLEASLGDMLRAFARILTHGGALWWFDMWGGWYDHDALRAFHRWACDFYRETCLAGGLAPRAQLAVFLDEDALNGFAPADGFGHCAVYEQMVQLGWLGAPYDTYLFSDFASVDPARYRAALFLSPAGFSEAQLRRLADWKREGRSLLFSGYPGYAAGKLGEACEIACEIGADTAPLRAAYRGEAYPSLPCSGPQVALLPGDGDVVLAREENGAAAAVLHRNREYQILWSVVPQLPAAMVREALLLAGAHIYLYTRDTVSAAGNLVCVHACEGGVKRVYFPRLGRAFDAIHGKRLPGTELYAEMEMQLGETRLLRLELAEEL